MYKHGLVVLMLLTLIACGEDPASTQPKTYVSFPAAIDPQCRGGKAKIFDECGDQSALFNAALARAQSEGKVLLVEYGAEWCIWCHVFDAHINGERGRFRYTYGTPEDPEARYSHTFEEGTGVDVAAADSLRDFVAASFVIVHIDAQYAPNAAAVLSATGADEHFQGSVPFVFTVDATGRFAAALDQNAIEKRRDTEDWYRGYDRAGLARQLAAMRDAARAADAGYVLVNGQRIADKGLSPPDNVSVPHLSLALASLINWSYAVHTITVCTHARCSRFRISVSCRRSLPSGSLLSCGLGIARCWKKFPVRFSRRSSS